MRLNFFLCCLVKREEQILREQISLIQSRASKVERSLDSNGLKNCVHFAHYIHEAKSYQQNVEKFSIKRRGGERYNTIPQYGMCQALNVCFFFQNVSG